MATDCEERMRLEGSGNVTRWGWNVWRWSLFFIQYPALDHNELFPTSFSCFVFLSSIEQ